MLIKKDQRLVQLVDNNLDQTQGYRQNTEKQTHRICKSVSYFPKTIEGRYSYFKFINTVMYAVLIIINLI